MTTDPGAPMTHADTPPMPAAVARLDTDKHGRPIPWFVHREDDGTPDFRVIRRDGITDALRFGLCWVCGQPRGRHAAFVIGPMCAVNRVTAEPPSHLPCAVYSARACPFLSTPGMVRRPRGIDHHHTAGIMIPRNPGVALVWSSRTWQARPAPGGLLFNIGDPTAWSWWAEGREATPAEVDASIQTGMPILMDAAIKDGPEAVVELAAMAQRVLPLIPA